MADSQEPQAPPQRPKRPSRPKSDRGPNLVALPVPGKKKPNAGQRARKSLVFDSRLLTRKVSPKSLAEGSYQKKLLSGAVIQLAPEALDQLYAAVQEGNLQAVKMTLEAVGILQSKSGVSIITNNNIDQRSVNIADQRDGTTGGPVGRRSFEAIARGLAEARERRQVTAGAMSLTIDAAEPTPEREGSPNKEYQEGDEEGGGE